MCEINISKNTRDIAKPGTIMGQQAEMLKLAKYPNYLNMNQGFVILYYSKKITYYTLYYIIIMY